MFEAREALASNHKKIFEAIRELVNEANLECTDTGLSLQAMDNSHVALTCLSLGASGFDPYRCDKPMILGISLNNLCKILRCVGNDDIVTLKAEDQADVLQLVCESTNHETVSEFKMKLMDIDQEHLGIPDSKYSVVVTMSSTEFARIVKDSLSFSETIAISATKDEVRFLAQGDIGDAQITIKPISTADGVSTTIEHEQDVDLRFSCKILNQFARATPLCQTVKLSLSSSLPLLVEYQMPSGHLRFYLAYKIAEED